jgi:uncharacterized Zn-binding protein involved in type VI secretion
MAAAARLTDQIAPHGCWSGDVISSASSNVVIGGQPAARQGDSGVPHTWICPGGSPPHSVTISGGSGSVYINGLPAARIGDPTDCGSVISSGSSNVTIG